MEEVKKSIFKQSEKKKVYKKNYYRDGEPYVDYDYETTKENKFECNLSMPLLQQNDRFYIEEEDKTVTVAKAIRTSKDNVLYICYDNVDENRDDLYLKLKAEVEEDLKEFKLKEQEKQIIIAEPVVSEVTGFRKFIKNLFKL